MIVIFSLCNDITANIILMIVITLQKLCNNVMTQFHVVIITMIIIITNACNDNNTVILMIVTLVIPLYIPRFV